MQEAPLQAMSADLLLKRGRCCRSTCLHCPYGHTIKKHGLKFSDVDNANLEQAERLVDGAIDLSLHPLESYKFITLKDFVCGVIRVDKLFVREFFLLERFRQQNISKELVESYYFY